MLRYANRNISGKIEASPGACLLNTQDVTNADQFNQALSDLLTNLSSRAAAGGHLRKYAAGSSTLNSLQNIYAMVQCTPDLSAQECGDCLSAAKKGIGDCCLAKMGCRVLRPSCFLRFESLPFYQTPVPLPPSPSPPSPTPPFPSTGGKVYLSLQFKRNIKNVSSSSIENKVGHICYRLIYMPKQKR